MTQPIMCPNCKLFSLCEKHQKEFEEEYNAWLETQSGREWDVDWKNDVSHDMDRKNHWN